MQELSCSIFIITNQIPFISSDHNSQQLPNQNMDKSLESSTLTTATSTSIHNDGKFITIPVEQNLDESLDLMTEQQIDFNLLELNLVSMFNEQILNKLYGMAKNTKFYLKNRYTLQKLINCVTKPKPKQKPVKQIVQKYDTVYVNGCVSNDNLKDKTLLKNSINKQVRAKFISSREQFSALLDTLSLNMKEKQKLYSNQDLRAYFQTQLAKINTFEFQGLVSPNKKQIMKQFSYSSSSESSIDSDFDVPVVPSQIEQISSNSTDSPKKQPLKKVAPIFSICYHNKIHHINQILVESSSFIRTKNRCPLILDLGFTKFLYKNDNQVAHELISMHLMHYINRIISPNSNNNDQIIEYQIIPQAYGALYQFVDNSMTVSQIKKMYKGGIPEYLDYLEHQSFDNSNIKMSNIRRRFSETLAGFCLVQYILDLKDRNNSNIMIRNDGSIFHIDLAFIFNATPGGIGFQSCPFKLTKQYVTAMGGFESDCFKYYQTLMVSDMTKLSVNRKELLMKVQILSSRKQQIMCFKKFKFDNFKEKIPKNPEKVREQVEQLIADSYDNWRTNQYDDYQFNTNRILK